MWAQRISYYVYDANDEWVAELPQKVEALAKARQVGVGAYYVRRIKGYDTPNGSLRHVRQSGQACFVRTCLQCTCTIWKGGQSRCETIALLEGKTIWGQRGAPTKVGKKKKIYKAWHRNASIVY